MKIGKGDPPQTKSIRDLKPFTSNVQLNSDFEPFFNGKHIGRYELYWKGDNWIKYGKWLAAPRNLHNFLDEKILIRKIVGGTLIATYIPETSFSNTLLHVLKLKNNSKVTYKYLLGIINSKLIGWFLRKKLSISSDDTFPQIMIRDIEQFTIPIPINKEQQNRMISLVERMLALHKRSPQTPHEQEVLQREISATDAAIDRLVYQLYGLTEEEIKIVEGKK